MLVPNRHGSSTAYRYGFQGQEKDDELKGEGNSLNYTFRMHDPRVGRFFAVDPLESYYPFFSPYQFNANSPLMSVELEGLEASNDPNQVQIPFTHNETPKTEYGPKNSIFANPIELNEVVITRARKNVDKTSNFEKYQAKVFKHEGGYVNDPTDPGGATNKGIIFRNFKKWANSDLGIEPTLGNLQNLSNEQASVLYKKHFWDTFRGDEFDSGSVAFALYDWTVTSGGAIKQLEKNLSKTLFSGITVDGKLSSNEVALLNTVNDKQLFELINGARLDYYDELIDKSVAKYKRKHPNASEKALKAKTLLKFKKGWTKRVNGIKFDDNSSSNEIKNLPKSWY
jgi:RHS repeat-associated protein